MDLTCKPTGRRLIAGLLVVFALFGSILVWWTSKPSGQSEHSRSLVSQTKSLNTKSLSADPSSAPVIRHPQGSQRANFALFRTRPEGLPRSVRQVLRQPRYGLNWALAQKLPVNTLAEIWAVPGNGFICLISQQKEQVVGATCSTTKEVLSYGLATTFLNEASTGVIRTMRVIVGMAPDRTREVIAHTRQSTVRIPVVGGVFMRRDEGAEPPGQLTLVGHPRAESAMTGVEHPPAR